MVIKDIQNSLGLVLHFPQSDMLLITEHKDIKLRIQFKKKIKKIRVLTADCFQALLSLCLISILL